MTLQTGLEWPAGLDVPALISDGWNPNHFREFIVKVHSRCDLSCDCCHRYEMTDQSWCKQPRAMSAETSKLTATRIGGFASGRSGYPAVSAGIHRLRDLPHLFKVAFDGAPATGLTVRRDSLDETLPLPQIGGGLDNRPGREIRR